MPQSSPRHFQRTWPGSCRSTRPGKRSDAVRVRVALLLIGIVGCSGLLLADDLSVEYDPAADFSTFKTFELRPGKVSSPRPELDNPIFIKKLGAAIRSTLLAK